MSKKNLRTIIAIIWFIVAFMNYQSERIVIAAASILIGLMFLYTAWKSKDE